MTNKQNLIDLIIRMFQSDDFKLLSRVDNNKISFVHLKDENITSYTEFIESYMGESIESYEKGYFSNSKYIRVPRFSCKITFNDGKSKLKLRHKSISPRWNPGEYNIENVKHTFLQQINVFKRFPDKIYNIKEETSKHYIQCGKIKEYLTIEEYISLSNKLIDLYQSQIQKETDILYNNDQLLIKETLNKI